MNQFLSEDEARALILNTCDCARGGDEDEIRRIIGWATSTRINQNLLDLTLSNRLRITFPEGVTEPIFLAKPEIS